MMALAVIFPGMAVAAMVGLVILNRAMKAENDRVEAEIEWAIIAKMPRDF